MKSRRTLVAALLASAAAVFPYSTVAAEAGPSDGTAARDAGRAGAPLTDDVVAARVKNAIANVDGIKAGEVEVEARDGVVTLRGPVATRSARDEALLAVRQIAGVRELKDELTVGNGK